MQERLSAPEVLRRIAIRVRKRIDALERVRLPGFDPVIHELKVVLDLLERGTRYLEGK